MPFKDPTKKEQYHRGYNREWHKRNKPRRQRLALERRYGEGATEHYLERAEAQKDCCAICGKPGARFSRELNLDHDHKTGKWRGLLCLLCNLWLSHLENEQWYTNAKKYLAEWSD